MKTREQHLEEQIERMEMSIQQYSKELNIVADLVKERNALRAELERVLTVISEIARAVRDRDLGYQRRENGNIVNKCCADTVAEIIAKLQSPPEHPASTSGNAAPAEAGPAPCVSDLPAGGNEGKVQASLTAAHETGACTSYDALRSIAERIGISRSTLRSVLSPPDASAAMPPTAGRQGNGGASQA